MSEATETPLTDRLRRIDPSDVFTYERYGQEGELILCGQVPIGFNCHCAADLIEQQETAILILAGAVLHASGLFTYAPTHGMARHNTQEGEG